MKGLKVKSGACAGGIDTRNHTRNLLK